VISDRYTTALTIEHIDAVRNILFHALDLLADHLQSFGAGHIPSEHAGVGDEAVGC
jgi:hypothetical protein